MRNEAHDGPTVRNAFHHLVVPQNLRHASDLSQALVKMPKVAFFRLCIYCIRHGSGQVNHISYDYLAIRHDIVAYLRMAGPVDGSQRK